MKRGFDGVAPFYDLLATVVFGGAIARSQVAFLEKAAHCRVILVLGGGTGKFLPRLLEINSFCDVWYVDASPVMIARARARTPDSRVHFICGTERDIPQDLRADCIITYFYLDLFSTAALSGVIRNVRCSADDGAWWLVADFGGTGRLWQRALLRIMYVFFRVTCGISTDALPDWKEALRVNGIACLESASFFAGFIEARTCQIQPKS